jgi:hypothetical protein
MVESGLVHETTKFLRSTSISNYPRSSFIHKGSFALIAARKGHEGSQPLAADVQKVGYALA